MSDSAPKPPKAVAISASAGSEHSSRQTLDAASVRTIVLGIMLAMFLSALDQTIVATALPVIGHDLGAVENLSWVVTAYLLSATAVTPLYGKLSDIYGRRAVLLAGIGVFIAGSIGCALAQTMPALIFARAVQGLGGGGLIALSQTIIADIMSPKERSLWQAYFGIVFAFANVAGAVLGGLFAQHLHWSLVFWINVPLGLLALAMTFRALAQLPHNHRRHRLDVLGALLMAAATITLLLALTWGGARYGWGSATIGGLLVSSLVLWGLFGLRIATTTEPFLPLTVLFNPIVRNTTLSSMFAMGTMIGLSIYVPLYLQAVMGLSPSASGLGLIPLFTSSVLGATISGRSLAFVEHYKRLPLIGLGLGTIGFVVLAVFPGSLSLWMVGVLLSVIGLATGALFPVATVAMQNAVHPHEMGTATASMNFSRQLGGAILVAGYGAILIGVAGGLAGPSGRGAVGLPTGTAARDAVVSGFGWIFAAAAAGMALAFLFLLLTEERPLGERPPSEA